MIDKLVQIFGSLNQSLDVLYVIADIKPVARVSLHSNQLSTVIEFCKLNKLLMDNAPYKILIDKAGDKANYSEKGTRIKLEDPRPAKYFLYISKDEFLAKQANAFECKNDHYNLGVSLGYPECCARFFAENYDEVSKKNNDYTLPALRRSEGNIFQFFTNICARFFDMQLISHFPCSFNCHGSQELGRKHLNVLGGVNSQIADKIIKTLRGGVVYTENDGVFLLKNSQLAGTEIHYNGVLSTIEEPVFMQNRVVKIIDKHHIIVGNQTINSPNELGVMFFK